MKIYCLLFVLCMTSYSNEQAGASIVYDPKNGLAIGNLLKTMKELKEGADEWKSNAAFLNKIMSQGNEVKRLFSILEAMSCATDEMEIYLGLEENVAFCEQKLEIDMTLFKIESISKNAQLITTGAIVLTQYETIKSLADLNDELEKAVGMVAKLNRRMRLSFSKWMDDYEQVNVKPAEHPWALNYNI